MGANQMITSAVKFCFLKLLVLNWLSVSVVGEDFGVHLNRSRRDVRFDRILKIAESVTYPPDHYWKEVQKRIPLEEPFPCDRDPDRPKWRSDKRPQSVHELRPGDIDVIGAMGDSLTAGSGGREFSPIGVIVNDRGISFSGGGLGSWRDFLTLPNIMKVFNPKLIGYSLGRGDFGSYNAQLNVAIAASYDSDMLRQAKIFVSKMKKDPRVNFADDWKLLTILVGHNDLCSRQCFSEGKKSVLTHKQNLQRTLDYLYANVPRIFVNLMPVIDVSITARVRRTNFCVLMNAVLCSCLFYGGNYSRNVIQLSQLAHEFQKVEEELVFSDRYTGRNDFTVEFQPSMMLMNMPRRQDDKRKLNHLESLHLFTPDCVHFNQIGMQLVTKGLWLNMLEPTWNKSKEFDNYPIQELKCPTKQSPYLSTKENSKKMQ